MSAIFEKEFKNSMRTMTGPIFIAFMLLWFGIYAAKINLSYGYSQFEYTIASASFLSLIALPLLTMRTFSEEKRSGSDKLLYSLPVKTSSIVISKYLSSLAVFAIPLAAVAFYPLIMSQFGNVYFGTAYSSLLAYFFLGGALISIGIFISSLTESQVIAAVLSLGSIILVFFIPDLTDDLPQTSGFSLIFLIILSLILCAAVYALTRNAIASAVVLTVGVAASLIVFIVDRSALEGLAVNWINVAALFTRMNNFFYGRFDIASLVYYVSITALFLFLTSLAVEKKRWN
ncbi:MAG: ABC-2 transporter permease [Clostridia bacterium]|nr:ABC-2 transporter permease [Clostridia bacterium]